MANFDLGDVREQFRDVAPVVPVPVRAIAEKHFIRNVGSEYDFTATPLRGRMSGATHCLYHGVFRRSQFNGEPADDGVARFLSATMPNVFLRSLQVRLRCVQNSARTRHSSRAKVRQGHNSGSAWQCELGTAI
jgi:hypothetical protein